MTTGVTKAWKIIFRMTSKFWLGHLFYLHWKGCRSCQHTNQLGLWKPVDCIFWWPPGFQRWSNLRLTPLACVEHEKIHEQSWPLLTPCAERWGDLLLPLRWYLPVGYSQALSLWISFHSAPWACGSLPTESEKEVQFLKIRENSCYCLPVWASLASHFRFLQSQQALSKHHPWVLDRKGP